MAVPGELEPLGDGKKAVCQYCFSVMVLPTLDPEAFNRERTVAPAAPV